MTVGGVDVPDLVNVSLYPVMMPLGCWGGFHTTYGYVPCTPVGGSLGPESRVTRYDKYDKV